MLDNYARIRTEGAPLVRNQVSLFAQGQFFQVEVIQKQSPLLLTLTFHRAQFLFCFELKIPSLCLFSLFSCSLPRLISVK